MSVDISPAEHRQLMRIAARMADELGVTRVAHQEIMRALLRLMLAEPEVLDKVRAEVEDWRRLAP